MIYNSVQNADKGIIARHIINTNFEKLYDTGLVALNLLNTYSISLTANTSTKVNFVDNIVAVSNDIFKYSDTNKTITILKNGLYYFLGDCVLETSNANEILEFILVKNGIETNIKSIITSSGSGKKNTVGYNGFVELNQNDTIEFYVKVEENTTLTVYFSNIGLEKKVF